jgi:dCMP deaminase
MKYLSRTDISRLKIAEALAYQSPCSIRHGAALFVGGRLISGGWNKPRNDPRFSERSCSLHAEADCLVNVNTSSNGVIYVVRVSGAGYRRMSMPCDACQRLLIEAGVKRAVFSTEYEPEMMSL